MSTLKIVKYDTFKKWLEDIKNGMYDQIIGATRNNAHIKTLSDFTGISRNTVSNWYNKGTKPSSEHLKKIFKAFGDKLTYEDLGVKEVDDKQSPSVFTTRLAELMAEKNWNNKTLAEKIDVTESAVSSWLSGRSMPTEEKMIELAKLFDVTTEYLKGTSNVRKIENIDNTILKIINEAILRTIKENSPDTLIKFMGKTYTLEELGEKYFDVYTFLIDPDLITVLREETERVVTTYLDEKKYHQYQDIINRRTIKKKPETIDGKKEPETIDGKRVKKVLGHTKPYTAYCSIKDISRLNIHREIDRIFDEFVKQKTLEAGLSLADIDRLDKDYPEED